MGQAVACSIEAPAFGFGLRGVGTCQVPGAVAVERTGAGGAADGVQLPKAVALVVAQGFAAQRISRKGDELYGGNGHAIETVRIQFL